MSIKYPKLTGKQIIRLLRKHGFDVSRIRGSHHILSHPDGRRTVVPVHRGETLGPGLLNRIAQDVDLRISDFKKK